MEISNYINERLENQINWYDKKAIEYKCWANSISLATIIISSSGGFINLLPYITNIPSNIIVFLSSIFSFSVASLLAFTKIKKYEELQSTYRMTCEKLKSEKYLFLTESGDYKIDNSKERDSLLVSRIESILSTEVGNWAQLNEKKEAKSK